MIDNLTVVIMAYQRPESLKRLLDSILHTKYNSYKLNFVFSLDNNFDSKTDKLVNDFEIKNFKKEIIKSKITLGAENHNLMIQQLAFQHENILILEDDSFVSPYIFDYAFSALNFYNQSKDIAAISLYPYLWVESVSVPFIPLHDGYCNYFQQRPTSHGYLLTKDQVLKFNEWHGSIKTNKNQLPPNTLSWNQQSWERIWYNYLIDTNQFVVFPRVAFNTVFGELGFNVKSRDEKNAFQQSVAIGKASYNFSTLDNSLAIYDAFYEFLKFDRLGFKNMEGNLYGTKFKSTLKKDLVAINGFHKSAKKLFGLGLKPIELNLILNNSGNEISIIDKNEFAPHLINTVNNHLYFHSLFSLPSKKILLKFYLRRLALKLKLIK